MANDTGKVEATRLPITPMQAAKVREAQAVVDRANRDLSLIVSAILWGHDHESGRYVGVTGSELVVILPPSKPPT